MKHLSEIFIINIFVAFFALPCFADGSYPPDGKLVTTASGLQYRDIIVGTGATPTIGKQVTVNYLWTKKSGTDDRNVSYSFKIGSGQVVAGFEEGVKSMKVGGRRVLFINNSADTTKAAMVYVMLVDVK